ncbi:hypothetical protein [Succinimonas sp.]|uniref:hypothetical protein n=1 Tax=Succinimonas sp. TaxID=1936151 RepID=UPI00386E8D88
MLEDYIKHYAGSLGVKPGDQAAITPEDNSSCYAITLNDSLVCTIEEAAPETVVPSPAAENPGAVFRFSVAFSGLTEPEPAPDEGFYQDQLNSYDVMSRRLLNTPGLARVSLMIVPENAVIGLKEDLPEAGLTPEMFVSRLNEFIDTALYLSGSPASGEDRGENEGDDRSDVSAAPAPDKGAARAREAYLALLAAMDITEEKLEETCGRLQVSQSFGTSISFLEASGCLLIENSITGDLSCKAMAFLLSENARLSHLFRFDYRSQSLRLWQILDLTQARPDHADLIPDFETALYRQEQLLKDVYDSLGDFKPEAELTPFMNFTPGGMIFMEV